MSRHHPLANGTAAGRILLATVEGLVAEGHDVRVASWDPSPPSDDLPAWCTWAPIPRRSPAREHLDALARPRGRSRGLADEFADDRIAVADDPASSAAVEGHPTAVGTLHYATALDAAALGRYRLRDVQEMRAEARTLRRMRRVLAYSPRVAAATSWMGRSARVRPVPAAIPVPTATFPVKDAPIAVLVADWSWEANRRTAGWLVDRWPQVRERVRGALLILAGRGDLSVGTAPGVRSIGPVERADDVLSTAAILAFPCPPTSGPKVKVLEAFAAGLPVVTTPAGVEGIVGGGDAAFVANEQDAVDALVTALADPARRAALAAAARATVERHHAPRPAARARVAALGGLDGR